MLALGIVAHTARAAQAKTLAATVRADFISIDNGLLGCDGNHRAVQAHLAGLPTGWSVILEDDAQPIDGFAEQLHAALPMSPGPIVSLYLGRKRPAHWMPAARAAVADADTAGACWIVATHLLHAVGYAIRTELLGSLLDHPAQLPADEQISDWAARYGHTVAYTAPGSLVEHADTPTLFAHRDGATRTPGRKAWRLGGHDRWTTTTVTMRKRPPRAR